MRVPSRSVVTQGPPRRGRRRASLFAALLAVSLLSAGCTRPEGESEVGAQAGSGAEQTGSAPAAGGDGTFGDLEDVCGPGDASGDTAQGVTGDSIKVGTISDPGFVARQGLNQELFDA